MRFGAVICVLAASSAVALGCERDPPLPGAIDAARPDARPVDVGFMPDARPGDAGTTPTPDASETDDVGPNDDATTPGGDDATAGEDARPAGDAATGGPDATTMTPDSGPAPTGTCAAPAAGSTGAQRYAAILGCLRSTSSDGDKRAAIDQFVTAVEEGEGFPIVDGNDLVFVYVRSARWDAEDDNERGEDFDLARRSPPITVSGDFNAWVATGPAMTDEGLDFFHARIPAPAAGTTRSGYKLVARNSSGDPVYFSDPLSRRFDYDGFGRISFLRGGDDHGHLERLRSVHATQLNNDRVVYVWLPPGYESRPNQRYPVLYMHDGNNLFSSSQPFAAPAGSWEIDRALEAEIMAMRIRAPIVVGVPNNADRFEEYTHVPDDINGNGNMVGGRAAQYGDFLVNDVKPRIDARFRTEPGRDSTGVIGSSLGGLVSYAIGLAHPTVFKFVGGMSSTFGWGQFGAQNPTIIEQYAALTDLPARDQVFYLDSGGGPPSGGCMGLVFGGNDNYCATAAMRDALIAEGVTTFPDDPNATPLTPADIDIYHWHQSGAAHNESAWGARFFRVLRLFFRP